MADGRQVLRTHVPVGQYPLQHRHNGSCHVGSTGSVRAACEAGAHSDKKNPETQTGEVTCPRSHPKLVMEADLNLGLSQACVLTCHMLTRDLPAVTYSKSTAPVLLEAQSPLWVRASVLRVENSDHNRSSPETFKGTNLREGPHRPGWVTCSFLDQSAVPRAASVLSC